jgi:hypothetical protein
MTASVCDWQPVPAAEAGAWNARLLRSDASLHQYPYWNEPYRQLRWTPHYLRHGPAEAPLAFACVVVLGVPPLRLGLVHRGPVVLAADAPPVAALAAGLLAWAREQRIGFLRFTHTDAALLDAVASAGRAERCDSFPFHRADPASNLIVHLPEDEQELTRSFRKDARREIRRDLAKGYRIRVETAPRALEAVWPMFEAHAKERSFRHFRSLAWWLELMAHAEPHGCARLYVATLGGTPVAADLYVRSRTGVRSITAWDERALDGNPCPSTFLAWHAMCDLRRLGIREYTLGPSTGSLLAYKQRFDPSEVVYPEPVTLVASDASWALWKATALPASRAWPRVRSVLKRF